MGEKKRIRLYFKSMVVSTLTDEYRLVPNGWDKMPWKEQKDHLDALTKEFVDKLGISYGAELVSHLHGCVCRSADWNFETPDDICDKYKHPTSSLQTRCTECRHLGVCHLD